ncbi:MAG TPA: tail fiber domain-containing protein, partial [Terriglobales bacterium]|nr:tail fiber domain-containing protein [Terriglobales bacterium]
MDALPSNFAGYYNTGVGYLAGQTAAGTVLVNNNTFLGAGAAGGGLLTLNNATAIGSNAEVTENNAMVLGSIQNVNGAAASTNVGIGTTAPAFTLDVNGVVNSATSFNLGGTPFVYGSSGVNANTFLGYSAGNQTLTGYDNVAVGGAALQSVTSGYGNTVVGSGALTYLTTGCCDTIVGGGADDGDNNSYDTCVGYQCYVGLPQGLGLINATAIGAHASVGQSNSLVLGGTGQWGVKVGIGTTKPSNILTIGRSLGHPVSDGWETYSSRRWKANIKTLPDALAKVEQLRGVSYDLKDSGKHEIGVIAEEVGKVVPEVVSYEKNGKDARGVDYSRLTSLLIEATKEQQALIRKQQQQIRTQQAQMKAQQAKGKLQEAQIAELMSQVKAIQASLQTNGRDGAEVRTVKARASIVQQ